MPEFISQPAPAIITQVGSVLKIGKVAIGSWNMDLDDSKTVDIVIAVSKLLSIHTVILDDAQTLRMPIDWTIDTGLVGGGVSGLSGTTVELTRITSGLFDNANYNDTGVNRGYITFIYEE